MKKIRAESVAQEVSKCTKKLKINEAVGLLIKTIKNIEKYQHIKFSDEDVNTITTYYSLTLLARVNTSKEYNKIVDDCSIEVKELEA